MAVYASEIQKSQHKEEKNFKMTTKSSLRPPVTGGGVQRGQREREREREREKYLYCKKISIKVIMLY